MGPQFSIIVPIYNVEDYLPACLKSLREQTYEDFEVILVDDGSEDSSAAICDACEQQDFRFRTIHKRNGGLVTARKAGIQTARGRYILNVDGDDSVDIKLLEDIHDVIARYSPDIVCFDGTAQFDNGQEKRLENRLEMGLYTDEQLVGIRDGLIFNRKRREENYGDLLFSVCLKAIKTDLLREKQLLVPDEIKSGEDLAGTMPAVCSCRSLYVSRINGYFYRQHEASMTHRFRPEQSRQYKVLFDYMDAHLEGVPHENIQAYQFLVLKNQLIQAASGFKSYAQFKTYALKEVYGVFGDIVQRTPIYTRRAKEWIASVLVKKKMLRVLFGCISVRNKK